MSNMNVVVACTGSLARGTGCKACSRCFDELQARVAKIEIRLNSTTPPINDELAQKIVDRDTLIKFLAGQSLTSDGNPAECVGHYHYWLFSNVKKGEGKFAVYRDHHDQYRFLIEQRNGPNGCHTFITAVRTTEEFITACRKHGITLEREKQCNEMLEFLSANALESLAGVKPGNTDGYWLFGNLNDENPSTMFKVTQRKDGYTFMVLTPDTTGTFVRSDFRTKEEFLALCGKYGIALKPNKDYIELVKFLDETADLKRTGSDDDITVDFWNFEVRPGNLIIVNNRKGDIVFNVSHNGIGWENRLRGVRNKSELLDVCKSLHIDLGCKEQDTSPPDVEVSTPNEITETQEQAKVQNQNWEELIDFLNKNCYARNGWPGKTFSINDYWLFLPADNVRPKVVVYPNKARDVVSVERRGTSAFVVNATTKDEFVRVCIAHKVRFCHGPIVEVSIRDEIAAEYEAEKETKSVEQVREERKSGLIDFLNAKAKAFNKRENSNSAGQWLFDGNDGKDWYVTLGQNERLFYLNRIASPSYVFTGKDEFFSLSTKLGILYCEVQGFSKPSVAKATEADAQEKKATPTASEFDKNVTDLRAIHASMTPDEMFKGQTLVWELPLEHELFQAYVEAKGPRVTNYTDRTEYRFYGPANAEDRAKKFSIYHSGRSRFYICFTDNENDKQLIRTIGDFEHACAVHGVETSRIPQIYFKPTEDK